MEQKDRLIEDPDKMEKLEQIASHLVAPTTDAEDLDHLAELRQEDFASFEDYLAAKERRKCGNVLGAGDSSSQMSSNAEAGTNGSAKSSDAPNASGSKVEERKAPPTTPEYILSGLKHERLSHPIPDAPPVSSELTSEGAALQEAVEYETKLEVHSHPLVGSYVVETQQKVEKGDWWKETFLGGRTWALEAQPIESIIAKIHELDDAIKKIKAFQQGTRSGLEDRLKTATSSEKAKIREKDKSYRSPKKADGEAKVSKPKKENPRNAQAGKSQGMKAADALATGMGYTNAEILEKLKATNLLDEATEIYVNMKYPA